MRRVRDVRLKADATRAGRRRDVPQIESLFPVVFPKSVRNRSERECTITLRHFILAESDFEKTTNTLRALGLREFSRTFEQRRGRRDEATFPCTALAHGVQSPLQWKEARFDADPAIRRTPRLTGILRCSSSRHSWAVAES
jgi:hypothetical protein